jgi:hypothetical protein
MRAQGFVRRSRDGTHRYPPAPRRLAVNSFALSGTWTVTPEAATARGGARLDARVVGRHVYLVLSSPGRPRTVRVALDGRALPPVTASEQRLYELARPPDLHPHRLTLRPAPGVSGYAFTFG